MNFKLTAALLLFCLSILIGTAGAVSYPTNVKYYMSANTAFSATTSANLPVWFTFNAGAYQTYEAANMMNFVAFNGVSGNPYNCWLVGNSLHLQQTTNLYTSNNLAIACDIPEGGWQTDNNIYFGFYTTTTNNFNSLGNWGEQMALAGNNPNVDNGNTVFTQYTNFYGTTMPAGWSTHGTVPTISNGIIVSAAGAAGITTTYNPSNYYAVLSTYDTAAEGIRMIVGWVDAIGTESYGSIIGFQNGGGGPYQLINWGFPTNAIGGSLTTYNLYEVWTAGSAGDATLNLSSSVIFNPSGSIAPNPSHLQIFKQPNLRSRSRGMGGNRRDGSEQQRQSIGDLRRSAVD